MNVRTNDKIDKIFAATIALVAENGLHNTPMSKICKLSGVSAGTVYHYFESKEELINKLYIHVKIEIGKKVFKEYNMADELKVRFEKIWKNFFYYLCENPVTFSFIEQCSNNPQIMDEVKEEIAKFHAPYIGFVSEGIEAKVFKPIQLPLIFSLIVSSINKTVELKLSGEIELTDKDIDDAFNYCWDGLTV